MDGALIDKRGADWSNRIKSLGNSIVPQIAEIIGQIIKEADYELQNQP
jgi:hypothetical protein